MQNKNYLTYEPTQQVWHCYMESGESSLTYCISLMDRIGFEVISADYEADFLKLNIRPLFKISVFEQDFDCFEINAILNRAIQQHSLPDSLVRLCLQRGVLRKDLYILRAYVAYYCQIYPGVSVGRLYNFLTQYADLTLLLLDFFHFRFRSLQEKAYDSEKFSEKRKELSQKEVDKFFHFLWELMSATVRTNFYLIEDFEKQALSVKIDPKKFIFAQKPILFAEIFVYHPCVQGLHLRTSPIARGGIRWSDRLFDYRYEVLGLVKAQQIKNTLIVPSGAKGAYVITDEHYESASENEKKEKAILYYQLFIRGLLDLTDLSNQGDCRGDLRCYDRFDPYLVVAADKGTATFSDYANALSLQYGHWLGDAFASGGSQGYDHKKLGITAKGALISAWHHCQRLNLTETITVIGIGDLSGDVFGNGLTLWPHMQLLAAFNHKHIFIDPSPKNEAYAERLRLFSLPRSSWGDFDPSVLSDGGMIIERSVKSVILSPQASILLGVHVQEMSPDECIRLILKMQADFLFNGGIGTYVKASYESHFDISDAANDDVRVDARDLKVKAVIEGGNLGLSHQARVEFEKKTKGLINTDTLDNSAGVNCSDHEVNLKIFLELLMKKGLLTQSRDSLLQMCTQEIQELVLNDNQESNYLISFLEYCAYRDRFLHCEILEFLVKNSLMNLQTEKFDSLEEIKRRVFNQDTLSRAELIVLFGYIKIDLKQRLLKSEDLASLPLLDFARKAFPSKIIQSYEHDLVEHPLFCSIAVTQILNHLISHLGLSFFYRLEKETKKPLSELVRITLQIFKIFELELKVYKLRHSTELSHADKNLSILSWYRLILRSARFLIVHPLKEQIFELTFVQRVQAITLKRDSLSIEQRFAFLGLILLNRDHPESDDDLLKQYERSVIDLQMDWLLQQIEQIPIQHGFDAQARTFLRERMISLVQKISYLHFSNKSSQDHYDSFVQIWLQSLDQMKQLNVLTFGPVLILTQQMESFLGN